MNLFEEHVFKRRPGWNKSIIALDPGETTGFCRMSGIVPTFIGQVATKMIPTQAANLCHMIYEADPHVIVIEDYRVYKWKADQHSWADLHTPRLIGMIEYAAFLRGIPVIKQSAQIGKGFCTDDRLKEWGLYQPAKRHAMDAVRHACQFLMFGDVDVRQGNESIRPA